MELAPDFPVETDRLRLRPFTLSDVEALHAYRKLEEVCRYIPPEPMDRETLADRISDRWSRTVIEAEGQALILGIELAVTEQVIGDLMLAFSSANDRTGELGWVLNPDHSGRGYATEAAHALMHLAFDQLGLHRVIARVDSRNAASLKLAERLGMRREAHLVSNEWFKGEWTDEIDLALLEGEWAAQHPDGSHPCAWRAKHRG